MIKLRHGNGKTPKDRSARPVFRGFIALIAVMLLLTGCRRAVPIPTTATPFALAPTTTLTPTGAVQRADTPTLSTTPGVQTTPAEATGLAPSTSLPPTPTPTPCQPPPGWVTYTIRPGDTLFSLANKTNTTIEEIMQANCLDSNLIIAGEPLSLPSLPPAPSPLPTRHLPSPTSICDVPFVCSTPGPALVLATGGGNDPNFTPCEFHLQSAWLDKDVPAAQAVQLQIGQHLFVYACDFPAEVISATITSSDGSPNSAPIYTVHPNPDLKMGNASAVIDWAALPTHPTGKYILEASDKDNNLASLEFTVTAPSEPFILVVPSTGAPGDNFQVYYIHFPLNTNPTFQLFGEDQPVVGQPHTLSLRSQWQVFINQPFVPPSAFGWAVASLEMPAQLSPAAYTITLEDQSILFTFWLR